MAFEVDDAGLAGVAVIEADDLAVAADEGFDQLVGPADGLGGRAHDEEDHGFGGMAETLGPDAQPIGVNEFYVAIQHEPRLVRPFIKFKWL